MESRFITRSCYTLARTHTHTMSKQQIGGCREVQLQRAGIKITGRMKDISLNLLAEEIKSPRRFHSALSKHRAAAHVHTGNPMPRDKSWCLCTEWLLLILTGFESEALTLLGSSCVSNQPDSLKALCQRGGGKELPVSQREKHSPPLIPQCLKVVWHTFETKILLSKSSQRRQIVHIQVNSYNLCYNLKVYNLLCSENTQLSSCCSSSFSLCLKHWIIAPVSLGLFYSMSQTWNKKFLPARTTTAS